VGDWEPDCLHYVMVGSMLEARVGFREFSPPMGFMFNVERMGMVDTWCFETPGRREYSFSSHVHEVYSRIDYFVVSWEILVGVDGAEYAGIVISDHAPHWLDIRFRSG